MGATSYIGDTHKSSPRTTLPLLTKLTSPPLPPPRTCDLSPLHLASCRVLVCLLILIIPPVGQLGNVEACLYQLSIGALIGGGGGGGGEVRAW